MTPVSPVKECYLFFTLKGRKETLNIVTNPNPTRKKRKTDPNTWYDILTFLAVEMETFEPLLLFVCKFVPFSVPS